MARFMEWLLRLKPGELAGADSWAPTFAARYNNWIILALAVVFLALMALTLLSYLREGDNPRRVKLTIAAVRIVVLLLVLATLFEPGLVLRYKRTLYSSVVVLLDDSLSMSLKDRYADPVLRRQVAAKLGISPEQLTETRRVEIVRKILAERGGPLAKLAREHPLSLLRFSTPDPGREAYTRPLAALDYTGRGESQKELAEKIALDLSGALAELSAGGYETNLAAALRDAADRLQGRRVAGIVVVSDGQSTGGEDAGNRLGSALAHVRQRGIPVFAVGVGDPQPPQNVAVLRLQGPAEARKGATIEMTAYLSHRNCGGKTIDIRLQRRPADEDKWSDAGEASQIDLKGEPDSGRSESQEVKLRAEADELGQFVYRAVVKPLEGEFSAEDNSATAKLRIFEEKIKILLVSGDAGWEYQYVRNLLLRDPEQYAVSVWQQDADLKFNQEASTGMRLARLPRTRPELYEYEVVLLYDPAHTQGGFDQAFVDMLGDFVADHHGGLCFVASNKFSDTNLAIDNPAFGALAALLPVELGRRALNIAERIAHGEPTPWPVVPTPVGLDHPVLRLSPDPRQNLSIWRALPGVYWSHPVVRLKPLASSLAASGDPLNRTGDGTGEPTPMVAVQYYGKGRSLYVGFDETWRWRFVADAAYHRRFWTNLVDFLAAGRLQTKRIIITAGADRFAVGDTLRIRVQAHGLNYEPLEDETFVVDMIDAATRKVQKITLQRDPKQKAKGHYEATLPLKAVGTYDLTARRDDPDYKDEVAGKTITVTLPEEEFRHPEADRATLETMAPEGRFVMAHASGTLADIVPSGKMSVFHDVPHELWDVPMAIVAIVVLLAAEWILRKKYNMA